MSTTQKKIIYQVIESHDLAKLITEVNEELADGWKLQGGIASTHTEYPYESQGYSETSTSTNYLQALMKEE